MRIRILLGRRSRVGDGKPFLSPIPVSVRTAVLSPGFAETDWVHVFADGWSREVEELEPELLAAPLLELRRVAARADERRIALPSLGYAVVAFTSAGQPPLADRDRDFFWRVFQVPLFEQFLSPTGQTLAAECDAHQGLHILPGHAGFTGFPGIMETARCSCGQPGARIVIPLAAAPPRPQVMAAAAGD